jgi:hypothetical protein
MNDSYYFRTSDPDYIRHAPSMLEILSKAFPTIITQQESEYELQRLNHLLNKLKGSNRCYNIIAQKLRQCRNGSPCNSLICPHCQRNAFWRNWLCCMSCRGIQQNTWEWSCFSTRIRKLRRHGRTLGRSGRKSVVISRG